MNLAFFFRLEYDPAMIVRIVKLTIKNENLEECLAFTTSMQARVKAFEGCQKLELMQDVKHKQIIFSYSHWDSETALNHYRYSPFFKESWAKLKPWFQEKPEAWSMEIIAPKQ